MSGRKKSDKLRQIAGLDFQPLAMTPKLRRCQVFQTAPVPQLLWKNKLLKGWALGSSQQNHLLTEELIQTDISPVSIFLLGKFEDEFLCICLESLLSKFAQVVKALKGEVHNKTCSHAAVWFCGQKEEGTITLEKTPARRWAIAFWVQIFGIYRAVTDLWTGHHSEIQRGCVQNVSHRWVNQCHIWRNEI